MNLISSLTVSNQTVGEIQSYSNGLKNAIESMRVSELSLCASGMKTHLASLLVIYRDLDNYLKAIFPEIAGKTVSFIRAYMRQVNLRRRGIPPASAEFINCNRNLLDSACGLQKIANISLTAYYIKFHDAMTSTIRFYISNSNNGANRAELQSLEDQLFQSHRHCNELIMALKNKREERLRQSEEENRGNVVYLDIPTVDGAGNIGDVFRALGTNKIENMNVYARVGNCNITIITQGSGTSRTAQSSSAIAQMEVDYASAVRDQQTVMNNLKAALSRAGVSSFAVLTATQQLIYVVHSMSDDIKMLFSHLNKLCSSVDDTLPAACLSDCSKLLKYHDIFCNGNLSATMLDEARGLVN